MYYHPQDENGNVDELKKVYEGYKDRIKPLLEYENLHNYIL